ncbi:MAG TPA: HAD family phosphatase [Candidatus Acidoferrum sp.]|nr:HAD family phosphatase [Candidatus Acidoferrum sp.]
MLRAVIFDLDGVVADSHPIHETAWTQLLVEAGLDSKTLNLDFLYAGHPRREILQHYLGKLEPAKIEQLGRRKDELYTLAAKELRAKPGIKRALAELEAGGVLCALATSAGRVRTQETLEKFGFTSRFTVVVTGEAVRAAKPSPDIFLLAAQRLSVDFVDCVVVEDSVAGVAAALAADMACVGFAPAGPRLEELGKAGAHDLISEIPDDALGYFRRIAASRDERQLNGTARLARSSE